MMMFKRVSQKIKVNCVEIYYCINFLKAVKRNLLISVCVCNHQLLPKLSPYYASKLYVDKVPLVRFK